MCEKIQKEEKKDKNFPVCGRFLWVGSLKLQIFREQLRKEGSTSFFFLLFFFELKQPLEVSILFLDYIKAREKKSFKAKRILIEFPR